MSRAMPPLSRIERERQRLREAQAREVMPIIGPLLDAWRGLPNDVADMEELEEFSGFIDALEQAMDADPDSCEHQMVAACDDDNMVIGEPWCILCGSAVDGGSEHGK